jgi:hypothetical protein
VPPHTGWFRERDGFAVVLSLGVTLVPRLTVGTVGVCLTIVSFGRGVREAVTMDTLSGC